jgi:tetratricopeptide (TPR) repeat protein
MDVTLFGLALQLGRLEEHDRARMVYHRLIRSEPASVYIPFAYLSFADYYFDEGNMSAARQFYEKVTEFGGAGVVVAYSYYRIGWATHAAGDAEAAFQAMFDAMTTARSESGSSINADLEQAAREGACVVAP